MNQSYYQECQYYLFKKQQNAQIYNINSKIEFNSFAYYKKVKIFIYVNYVKIRSTVGVKLSETIAALCK